MPDLGLSDLKTPIRPWRISVDVGGTYTDMVLIDATGTTQAFKVPSVPQDPGRGVIDAITSAATKLSVSTAQLLKGCERFVHGSTVATNTLLEKRGASVGLLCTRGFRDSLEARRGRRDDPWDHHTPYPPVLVPRYLRQPVSERIDANGVQIQAIDVADIKSAIELFHQEQVEAVAVSLLHSYANPVHEEKIGQILRNEGGFSQVSLSHQVASIAGEYERTSTTVVNAYLMPRVGGYLKQMVADLSEMGLTCDLLILQSNGGACSLDQIVDYPVRLLLSGPAAGVGALAKVTSDTGRQDLLAMEIGGTSCDVMLMRQGQVAMADASQISGYDLVSPAVDIHTVGAGGGTIAGLDSAGMPFAGPQGAGANPGPAAYGLGATDPTVTDAQLVLGRLKPGVIGSGPVQLDPEAAASAMDNKLAKPAGISRQAAAVGVIQLVEQHLLQAVETISLQRGNDPTSLALVACGGAGPMHGTSVARLLGCQTVIIPREAGVFCASGMQFTNVRHDLVRELNRSLTDENNVPDPATAKQIHLTGRSMLAQAQKLLTAGNFQSDAQRLQLAVDLHYAGQQWAVSIPTDEPVDADLLMQRFETEYLRLYGHTNSGNPVIAGRVHLSATGLVTQPVRSDHQTNSPPMAPPVSDRRPVWSMQANDMVDTPVYSGLALHPGQQIDGPAIIDETTTTIVIDRGDRLSLPEPDNYLIDVGPRNG